MREAFFPALALLCALLAPSEQFLGNDIFSSADTRLFKTFCVSTVEELEAIGKTTWTHDSITREGIKRSIVTFFKEISDGRPFEVPEDASLSEVFQAFYGECASPDRFLTAVQAVVDANVDLDSQLILKEDPDLHFDAEHVAGGQKRLFDRNNQINVVVTIDQNFPAARTLLGQSLHSIQKFYSHTSWIESGETSIADLLKPGIPVAANTTDTCDNTCVDDCTNNLITSELTSGYLPYHEPSDQKCFHGGENDDVYSGINKDTSSPCYSPHYNQHKDAALMAIQATENYVNTVRTNINNLAFGRLFDLANSSALAILLDTSGSMQAEIDAVKLQIKQIIEEAGKGGVAPSEYILAAFESTVQFTKTQDPDVIIAALEKLQPYGGTEYIYQAAQMVLNEAPPYSDLLAFTDEGGDDEYLQSTVINLAQDQKSKINIIWTDVLKRNSSEDLINSKTIPGLQETCKQTGGLFMESSKVDVQDIVALLSQSIESTKATIVALSAAPSQVVTFPVDATLANENFRIGLTINGRLTKANLNSPDGLLVVNLLDDTSMSQSPLDFIVVYRGDSLLTLTFKPNQVGIWTLDLGTYATLDVIVTASCTFNFLSNFKVLDLNTTHPNLRPVTGKPIANSTPLVAVQLTAASRTQISAIDSISFVTPLGVVLHTYPRKNTGFVNEFLVNTEEFRIPKEKFSVRLEGKDTAGNLFWRLLQTPIEPASTSVEITASSSRIEAAPGESVSAEFLIKNYGDYSTIDIEVVDEKKFLTGISFSEVGLGPDETASVTASFTVPLGTLVGTADGIVVTVTSQLDGTQNYARTTLVVISDIEDDVQPTINVTSETRCTVASPALCGTEFWSFTADTFDLESGMGSIQIEAVGSTYNTTIPPFAPGSLDVYSVEFNADCCVRKSTISVLDVAGNANSVVFEMGPMKDCGRVYICPKCVDATTVTIEWNRPCSFDAWQIVDHYIFEFTGPNGEEIVTKTSICETENCIEEFFNLQSCVTHDLKLTAYQTGLDTPKEEYLLQTFTTKDAVTGSPALIRTESATDSTITLSWRPPVEHKECVHHYKVCMHEMPSGYRSEETCVNTPPITGGFSDIVFHTSEGLNPCTDYRFTISAFTSSGKESGEVIHISSSGFADPSPATGFRTLGSTSADVTLCWNKPETNPKCISRYETSFFDCNSGESFSKISGSKSTHSEASNAPENCDFTETIDGLSPCTCYNFTLRSVTVLGNLLSELLHTSDTTGLSSAIFPPESVHVGSIGDRSANVVWYPPDAFYSCIDGYKVDWVESESGADQGTANVEVETFSHRISNLLPCSDYNVTVSSLAEHLVAKSDEVFFKTKDNVPGIASNVAIDTFYNDGFLVTWCDPTDQPQCARTWDRDVAEDIIESPEIKDCRRSALLEDDGCYDLEVRQLECGKKYLFKLWATSPTGLIGEQFVCRLQTLPC